MEDPKRTSSTARVNRDHLDHVQSQIIFARRILPPIVGHNVTIRNARPIVRELSLDQEGFTLIQRKISCRKRARDPTVLRERYQQEMVPFMKDYFNASWVVAHQNRLLFLMAVGNQVRKDANRLYGLILISRRLLALWLPPCGPVGGRSDKAVFSIDDRSNLACSLAASAGFSLSVLRRRLRSRYR
ncbi:hypothetical protein [Bradyrhizobium sp. WSM1417]|uniref:hypothetical protein n=1 Tax=Bradyrhizobium sp. WSM1417 TaxID=754500 RepID=UPI0012EB332D|nr:hypothetical protein [Bradyrhizobium sp. WSM1417]